MTLASMQLDPNAVAYTDDQIVGKVNSASANISRASSVTAAARPIEALEVDTAELAAGAVEEAKLDTGAVTVDKIGDVAVTNAKLATSVAKANLDAMAAVDRGYVATNPVTGEYKITAIQRDSAGDLDVEYDDQAVS